MNTPSGVLLQNSVIPTKTAIKAGSGFWANGFKAILLFKRNRLALATMVFSSCDKDKTNEELLSIKKGWVMSKATSTPAYTNRDGVTDADLAKSWFYECELNDVLTFIDDKDGKRSVLTTSCNGNIKDKETLGTWEFTNTNPLKLKFRIPFFEEDFRAEVFVENLDADNFVFSYTWVPDEDSGIEYTFRVSYVPAK